MPPPFGARRFHNIHRLPLMLPGAFAPSFLFRSLLTVVAAPPTPRSRPRHPFASSISRSLLASSVLRLLRLNCESASPHRFSRLFRTTFQRPRPAGRPSEPLPLPGFGFDGQGFFFPRQPDPVRKDYRNAFHRRPLHDAQAIFQIGEGWSGFFASIDSIDPRSRLYVLSWGSLLSSRSSHADGSRFPARKVCASVWSV